jgi:FkbM family methyltransferase
MRKPWRFYLRHAKKKGLEIVRSAYGVKFLANYGDATFRYCVTGKYGLFLAKRIRAIDTPFVFLDIGANQGLYSLIAATNDCAESVYAFEPIAATANRLRRNVWLNDQSTKVEVIQAAVSSSDGSQIMTANEAHTGQARIIATSNGSSGGHAEQVVESLSGSSLAALIHPDDVPIYAKVDVEGHEPTVIDALLTASIGPRVKEIFFEMDESWTDRSVLERRLQQAGFALTPMGSGVHYDMLAVRTGVGR